MRQAHYKNKFKKDLERLARRGKDLEKLKAVMEDLVAGKSLAKGLLDHALKGEYSDCRECHIEPDWLLIYLVLEDAIVFVRSGTHSDLFK